MKKYILALDQGTTSCRCIIFDYNQNIIFQSQKEFQQYYPQSGWVEHSPMEIFSCQYEVLMEALTQSNIPAKEIAGIGITNQRETTILWDKDTGQPIYNAIVWQCRRTALLCEELKKDLTFLNSVKDKTGLLIDAYFSATKIKWILDNIPEAKEKAKAGKLLFGTVDTWLLWKLTNGKLHITDYTNASRTMLFNIKDLCWDKEICNYLNIPMNILPEVKKSSEIYETITIQDCEIPIAGIAGDQQAALFGQSCFNIGDVKNTYGTGCFLLMNTGDKLVKSKNGLITTIAASYSDKVLYALEGSVFIGGAVIQWLRDELQLIADSKDAEYYAQKIQNTDGVYFVPAFTGLGAPYWDMYARGCIVGLTRGTKREHIIRAAQESIAYQSFDLVKAMEKDAEIPIKVLNVDGGATRDNFLMQFQSDILNCKVQRPIIRETTALGAAFLAGLATGFWKNTDEIKKLRKIDTIFSPTLSEQERNKFLEGWHNAINRSLNWAK